MGDPVQESLLLPFGLIIGAVGDDGTFAVAPAKPFDDPNSLDPDEINIQNAGPDQPMGQQRFGFLHADAMNNAIFLRVQTRLNHFGEVWMRRQHQNGFHCARSQ